MKEKRILITGGAGFIGSNVANSLARRNEVIALDDRSLGKSTNLNREVRYVDADVRDSGLPTDVDVVIHLAALSSFGMHESAPAEGASVNVEGFVNVVEQARQDGCETVVYASTSSIYDSTQTPSPEDSTVTANTGYEASKLARERYAESFGNRYGMNLAGMRLFSVYQGYGGRESHKGEYANVIAQFADDLAHGRQPDIYGDGTQTRDFTHVDDVVRALKLAAEEKLHGIYNVGTGTSTDFNSLVERLNEEMGTNIEPNYVPNPIPEHVYVRHTCADSRKLHAATGWQPEIDLETGLRQVCGYYVEA